VVLFGGGGGETSKKSRTLTDVYFTQHTSKIKWATYFGLLSHDQALTKNIKKTLSTAIHARSPHLQVTYIINAYTYFKREFLTQDGILCRLKTLSLKCTSTLVPSFLTVPVNGL